MPRSMSPLMKKKKRQNDLNKYRIHVYKHIFFQHLNEYFIA